MAFSGRSNVGKSSLINGLVGMHKLARASNEPGRTREVNFFDLDGRLRLVDLPGYGYARVPAKAREHWAPLLEDYLKQRPNLKLLCSLMDCRHLASPLDRQLLDWTRHYRIATLIVLTKCDKLSRQALAHNEQRIRQELSLGDAVQTVRCSALKKTGRDELWRSILASL